MHPSCTVEWPSSSVALSVSMVTLRALLFQELARRNVGRASHYLQKGHVSSDTFELLVMLGAPKLRLHSQRGMALFSS